MKLDTEIYVVGELYAIRSDDPPRIAFTINVRGRLGEVLNCLRSVGADTKDYGFQGRIVLGKSLYIHPETDRNTLRISIDRGKVRESWLAVYSEPCRWKFKKPNG